MDNERPKYPLPVELANCDRDETVCHYCGVSYLIHHEIKRLEELALGLQRKLSSYEDLPQRYHSLKAEVREKEANFLKQISTVEDEKENLYQAKCALEGKLKKRDIEVSRLENNLVTSTESCQKLVKELYSISEQLYDTKVQFEKMKGEISVYEDLKEELDSLKVNDLNTRLQLVNERSVSESLKDTVDYLQEMADVARQHIKKLEEQVENITDINDSLHRKMSFANKKLYTLKNENGVCFDEEVSNVEVNESMNIHLQQLGIENENLKKELERVSSDREQLKSLENKLKSETYHLMTEIDKRDLEIEVLKAQDLILLTRFQEIQKTVDLLTDENKKLKDEVNTAKENEQRNNTKEQELNKEIEEVKAKYEQTIRTIKEDFEKQRMSLSTSIEKLEETIAEERDIMQTKLKEQESQLKTQYLNQTELLEEKLKQTIIECQQNEQIINSKWNAKLVEYREQMKAHVQCLEKQIEISTNNAMSRNNQLLKERTELSSKVQYLESQLRICQKECENKIIDTGKKYETLVQQNERNSEVSEYLKMNLVQKEKMIELLQETVHRECEEREDMLKKLEVMTTKSGNGDTSKQNMKTRIGKNNLSKTLTSPKHSVTSDYSNIPQISSKATTYQDSLQSVSLKLDTPSSTLTQYSTLPKYSANLPMKPGAKHKNVFTSITKSSSSSSDNTAVNFEFMIGKGSTPKVNNSPKKPKSIKMLHKNSQFDCNLSAD